MLASTPVAHVPERKEKPRGGSPALRLVEVAALALLFTLADAFKPLHIDDAAYYEYARQIAAHPLDPYRFSIFWYDGWQPAQQVLAPPVLPYWWAAGLHLFGDRPLLWKLWLFPFCLLFVFALETLFRRFARGLERPLLWMTVLAPAFLPHLNLMLDIPALALTLTALVLFMRAVEQPSILWAVSAGLVAGLAMQTKYTGLLAPAIFFVYALLATPPPGSAAGRWPWRGLLLWLVATLFAGVVFVGWEGFLNRRHPEDGSHFLYHLHANGAESLLARLESGLPALPGLLGGMAAGIGLLTLVALRARPRFLVAGIAWVVLTYGAVLAVGVEFQARGDVHVPFHQGTIAIGGPFPLEGLLFGALGVAVAVLLALACSRLVQLHWPVSWCFWGDRPLDWFLVAWLVIEVAGYFMLNPFPAVRRLMGTLIVATLLAGRLASQMSMTPSIKRLVWSAAILNIALGVLYAAVDFSAARASQVAVEQAADWIGQHGGGRVWYTGHWGFQFYAERRGMLPVAPKQSWLAAGDWLVIPDAGINQQSTKLDKQRLERVARISVPALLPITTIPRKYGAYYDSGAGVPLLHQDGPQVEVAIYRVLRGHVCR